MRKHNADEKLELMERSGSQDDDEEREEALSLCDLPVIVNEMENQRVNEAQAPMAEEDFEFGSWGGPLLRDSEMCAADDVFFQGQILPLRLSVNSDSGLLGIRPDSRNPSRSASRSESMDHSSSCGFTSGSSRSSSIRSHHSLSSRSWSTTSGYKQPGARNQQLLTHPSPKPQLWVSGSRWGSADNRSRKSTIWGIFRFGLVSTPQIELQSVKLRYNTSVNSSSNGSRNISSSSNTKNTTICSDDSVKKGGHEATKAAKKKGIAGLMSGCKCSADAVDTVSSKIAVIRSSNSNSREKVSEREAREEKQKQKREQQGKQAVSVSHRRTFEWLNQLSTSGAPE